MSLVAHILWFFFTKTYFEIKISWKTFMTFYVFIYFIQHCLETNKSTEETFVWKKKKSLSRSNRNHLNATKIYEHLCLANKR